MSERDVLDKKLLEQFKWRTTNAASSIDPDSTHDADTNATSPREITDEDRTAWAGACAAFARNIERTWPLSAGPHDEDIARQGQALGLIQLVMFCHNHPLEAVRFARIVVRSSNAIRAACGNDMAFGLTWMRLEHPEVVDLLVEAVTQSWHNLAIAFTVCAVTEENGKRVSSGWAAARPRDR